MRKSLNRTLNRKHQAGFVTLQLALLLAVSGVLANAAFQASFQANRLAAAQVQGDNMEVLRRAGEQYVADNANALQAGTAVVAGGVILPPGSALGQSYSPRVADLVAARYLPAGFSPTASFSIDVSPGNYQVRIVRSPVTCFADPASCDVSGIVYIDTPITENGNPNFPMIAGILSKLGGNGGSSVIGNAATISGIGGGWTVANPLSGNPPGVVAGRFSLGAGGLVNFVRRQDTRDPDLRGALTVKNQVTADQFLTAPKTVGAACATMNAIAASDTGAVQCVGGQWRLFVEQGTPGLTCAPDGKAAVHTGNGQQLVCKNGLYTPLTALIPRNITVSRVLVKDGDVVVKPICEAGGRADRSFLINQVIVDVTVAPPKQANLFTTIDQSASWLVLIKARDDNGLETSGNLYSQTAILNLECQY